MSIKIAAIPSSSLSMSPPMASIKYKNVSTLPTFSCLVNLIYWKSWIWVPLPIDTNTFLHKEMWPHKFHCTVVVLSEYFDKLVNYLMVPVNQQ